MTIGPLRSKRQFYDVRSSQSLFNTLVCDSTVYLRHSFHLIFDFRSLALICGECNRSRSEIRVPSLTRILYFKVSSRNVSINPSTRARAAHADTTALDNLASTIMCRYYRHIWRCGHIRIVFAKYCPRAGLVQTACEKRDIWQSVNVDEACVDCYEPSPEERPLYPPQKNVK